VLGGRLHPLTLVFAAWHTFRGFLLPLVALMFFGNKAAWSTLLFVFIGIPLVLAVLRYFTFTYRIENGELITAYGVLGRTERQIPLARVQDIRIEQGVLHRLFGVAEVFVETAGGKGAEASLSVLSRSEAERLRAAVFERIPVASAAAAVGAATKPPEREIIRRLAVRELVLEGMTSNRIASALALLAVGWQYFDELLPKGTQERWIQAASRNLEQWIEQAGDQAWVYLALTAGAVFLACVVFSIIGSIFVFFGFTLSRSGEDLHRAYGLLTRRSSSLPRRRIQVLRIEETLLRRWFRLATLRADTAGSQATREEGKGGRDVLLPLVRRSEVDGLLPVFFPDLERADDGWQLVSRRAIYRGTVKGILVLLVLTGSLFALQHRWLNLWPLALLPAVYPLNVVSYRRLGYLLGERYFRTRRGWLSRTTHVVPIRNVQSIVIRQTPLDRRHGVGTLMVDTAGQAYTGEGPSIHNIPWGDARALARTLAHRAAATRYRWGK
jgi:putative membrane protein